MKAKILILSLSAIYALFLIGCKEERDEACKKCSKESQKEIRI